MKDLPERYNLILFMLFILSRSGATLEAAVLMRDAAEEKAERIFIRELRAAGLTEKA